MLFIYQPCPGTSCPKPVKHVNGSWTCEVQEVPIPTTAELSGGLVTKLDTYSGTW